MKVKYTFTSDSHQLAEVRHCVRSFLRKYQFDECLTELLVLGLDEACTNIIRHAYGCNGKPVRLEMESRRDRVRFILRDYGRSCDPGEFAAVNCQTFVPAASGCTSFARSSTM